MLQILKSSNCACEKIFPSEWGILGDDIGIRKVGACLLAQAVAPSPGHSRDGSEKVQTFDKRTHRHKPFDHQERLFVTPRSTAGSCRSMSSYGRVLAASSRVLAARSKPVYFFRSNLCRFRSKFAWALHLSLSSPWTMVFLRNDNYGQEMKISSKCPTSAIASPHVKYVKGC